MKEMKVRGIVIREEAMGEKDKRVVLLTEEVGKITILAKGAMSAKSRFGALTQLFCLGDYVVTKGRTFYYIKEARLVESFYALREDLDRLSYATLMAEVADTLSLEGQENAALVQLFLRGLVNQTMSEEGRASQAADVFIFRALAESGYYPELTHCRMCGRSLENLKADETVQFDYRVGSLICSHCRNGGIRLHSGAVRALRYMIEAPVSKAFSFMVTDEILKEIDAAVEAYLTEQTERRYQGLDFIQKLKHTS